MNERGRESFLLAERSEGVPTSPQNCIFPILFPPHYCWKLALPPCLLSCSCNLARPQFLPASYEMNIFCISLSLTSHLYNQMYRNICVLCILSKLQVIRKPNRYFFQFKIILFIPYSCKFN